MSDGLILLITGAMLTGGLAASLLAGRLRVPGLVLVLGLGMAIGSEGLGWISFNDYTLARRIGIVALSLILFEGGLAAGWGDIRPVFGAALSLAVVGTVVTGVIAGLAAASLFHLSTIEGLLLGSILASTDGAAVFAVLRGSTLRRRLARTLEGEAGLNDPVAVVLVIGFIDWATHRNYGLGDLLVLFVRQFGIGAAIGAVVAGMAVFTLRHARLPSAGLYPVASLAFGALAYGGGRRPARVRVPGRVHDRACDRELAVPAQRTIATFHDGLAWVAQLVLFLVLGLLVFPNQLGSVAVKGSTLALIVAVVARPVAVMVATAFAGFTLPERAVLGWAGLRGAVPVVLAIFPVIDGVSAQPRVLQHHLLRGAGLDDRAGHDVRAVCEVAGCDHDRSGAARAADRVDRDPPARCRGRRVRGRARPRSGRAARPRARPAARRAAEHHHSRRAGAPAARAPRGSSRATICTCSSARRRRSISGRCSTAGATGRWAAAAAKARVDRPGTGDLLKPALGRQGRRRRPAQTPR